MAALCNRADCSNPARATPMLLLRPTGYDGPPAEAHLSLKVCVEHMETTTLADLVTDKGWEQICANFASSGRVLPDRDRMELGWQMLDAAPYPHSAKGEPTA